MSQLHPSRIDVAEDDRAVLCELFSVSYAAMSDLRSQVVQARVSVRGSGSHGLNLLCDTVRDGVVEVADGLLARCVVLGGQPRTTIRAMSSATTLPEYDVEGTEAREHLEALADRFELVAAALRRNTETAARMEDTISAHVFAAACARIEAEMARLERA